MNTTQRPVTIRYPQPRVVQTWTDGRYAVERVNGRPHVVKLEPDGLSNVAKAAAIAGFLLAAGVLA